jgi:hypothetical protein
MDVDHSSFNLVHMCALKEISHHHKFLQDILLSILRKCITPSNFFFFWGGGGGAFLNL